MGGGPGARPRGAPPTSRNVYLLAAKTGSSTDDADPKPQPVRIKTGISDGAYTEVTDGLKEGDPVITSVKLPQSSVASTPPAGTSPFGGGGGRRGF